MAVILPQLEKNRKTAEAHPEFGHVGGTGRAIGGN